MELSDILIQIVDARNPELYRCEDLEEYVKEKGGDSKKCFLILNKADLLTENQRKGWAKYYNNKGITFVFFSALTDIEKMKETEESEIPNKKVNKKIENNEKIEKNEKINDEPLLSDINYLISEKQEITISENEDSLEPSAYINTHLIM